MDTSNTGGPAFPTPAQESLRYDHYEGMTMRDYFAAKAMQGLLACGALTEIQPGCARPYNEREIADQSYAMADAMLAAREVR